MANKPEDAPVGSGIAKQAVNTISLKRQYDESALVAAVSGEPHPDFDDWVKQQKPENVVRK